MAYFSALGGTGGTSATITVTYSEDFYGLTITATNGTTTLTKTATSSGTLVFDVSEGGTWVVSGTVEGATYSESVDVTFEYTAPPLVALPDGSTALPINDIQMWLKCAAIRDKTTYTTLADVLADTDTFIALCADSNACDYMARSTNWASGVTVDATAMLIVGKYNYCAKALLDDNTWETAIRNSPYSDYVNPVPSAGYIPLVPKMTSATTPSGTVISLNPQSSYPPFQAFDQNSGTYGTVLNAVGNYIGYEFDTPQTVGALFADCNGAGGGKWKVQYKINGSWEDVETLDIPSNSNIFTSLTQATQVEGVRLVITEKFSTYTGNGFNRLQFYRKSDLPIIHSAVEDNIFYMDDGSPVALCGIPVGDTIDVDLEAYKGQTLTLVSTVAKDPDNLSNDFSMNVRITPNITEIYLMPLGELYWWGHKGATLDIASTASGWTYSGTFLSPSYQKNYADCDSYNAWNIICFTTKNAVHSASKVCAIGQGIRKYPSDHYLDLQGRTSKTFNDGASGLVNGTTTLDVTTMAKIENDVSGGSDFYPVANTAGNQCYVYAVWYEV